MLGVIFVISDKADRKFVNRLLLYLRIAGYGGDTDCFHIVTSRRPLGRGLEPHRPPLENFDNQWMGQSIEDTEQFMLLPLILEEQQKQDAIRRGKRSFGFEGPLPNVTSYLVLDDQGVQDETIILVHRDTKDPYSEDDEEDDDIILLDDDDFLLDTFKKTRIPWAEVACVWGNLDLGNACHDELVDESGADENNGWCVATSMAGPDPETQKKIDAAIALLEDTGDPPV